MKEPKINPKLVIKIEPMMIREGGGYELLGIIIPITIIILSLIL